MSLGEHSNLTDTEIRIVVKMAVRDTLEEMGLDLSTPEARASARADFAYMRRQRLGGERIADWAKHSVIAAFVGGGLWAIWQGIKFALTAKGVTQ